MTYEEQCKVSICTRSSFVLTSCVPSSLHLELTQTLDMVSLYSAHSRVVERENLVQRENWKTQTCGCSFFILALLTDYMSRFCFHEQADSDASSDMSDDALNKLVSRLVEAGGDLDQEDAETLGVGQVLVLQNIVLQHYSVQVFFSHALLYCLLGTYLRVDAGSAVS